MPSEFKFAKSEKSGVEEGIFMKLLKGFGITLLSLPIILIVIFVLYEIFGMCVNHMTTKKQTTTLQMHLESEIPDKVVLNMLIDKIYIYHDKSVKFVLKVDIEKML